MNVGGPGVDQCQQIEDIFTYGCPLPNGSIHLDLSDVAMQRAQAGTLVEGVIPTQYRRVPCPKPGNVYVWLRDGAGPYYFQITAVNAATTGSIVGFEVRQNGASDWLALIQENDYPEGHPQERYGAWTLPPNASPIQLPMGIRLTAATGQQIVNEQLITSWVAPADAISGFWYIDTEIQFNLL
jgi:expansin (peptidoglycan-binding protein)